MNIQGFSPGLGQTLPLVHAVFTQRHLATRVIHVNKVQFDWHTGSHTAEDWGWRQSGRIRSTHRAHPAPFTCQRSKCCGRENTQWPAVVPFSTHRLMGCAHSRTHLNTQVIRCRCTRMHARYLTQTRTFTHMHTLKKRTHRHTLLHTHAYTL